MTEHKYHHRLHYLNQAADSSHSTLDSHRSGNSNDRQVTTRDWVFDQQRRFNLEKIQSFVKFAGSIKTTSAAGMTARKCKVPLLGAIRTENVLLLLTLLAVIGGTCIGLAFNPIMRNGRMLTRRQLLYLRFPGEMFLRMLKMLILPLVVASNVSAIASLNAKAARLTDHVDTGHKSLFRRDQKINIADSLLDMCRNMVPINLVKAMFEKTLTQTTRIIPENATLSANGSVMYNATNHTVEMKEFMKEVQVDGTNILGLITFSIMFGFAVHSLGADAAVLADMFHATRRVIVYLVPLPEHVKVRECPLVSFVIWFSPVGILCLIAGELANTEKLAESIFSLSWYALTVILALFLHGCVVLPLLLFAFTRRNPLRFATNMLQALMCALGTASSTATLPCTIRCLESGNGIDPRVTRFMLPLGTTINMDGTATFQAIATVYISQMVGEPLELSELIMVGLTSMMASMASTSMPSAGLITIVMVLSTVGLPHDKISILLPVDWFLDRFRTMVNVFGNSVGAAILSHVCHDWLQDDSDEDEPNQGNTHRSGSDVEGGGSVTSALDDQTGLSRVGRSPSAANGRPPNMAGGTNGDFWHRAQANPHVSALRSSASSYCSPLSSEATFALDRRRLRQQHVHMVARHEHAEWSLPHIKATSRRQARINAAPTVCVDNDTVYLKL